MADSSKVELILTADSRQAVQGIRETQKAADDLNKSVVAGQKEQVGAIESIEKALKELEQGKKKAYDPDQIARYNKKISEAKYELDQLNRSGATAEKQVESLSNKIGKWALGLVTVGKLFSDLNKAFKDTVLGLNLMTKAGELYKQTLYNIVEGQGMFNTKLASALAIGKQLNSLRQEERSTVVDLAKMETQYFKLRSEASDQMKSDEERLMLLNQAELTHNLIIDKQLDILNKRKSIIVQQLIDRPKSIEAINAEIAINVELEEVEKRRYSQTRALTVQKSALLKKGVKEEEKSVNDLYKLYDEYYDWYRDQVDKTIKDEADAKEKAWDEEMEMAYWRLKVNKHIAEEQAKEAGLLDTESEEGKKNFETLKQSAGKIVDVYMDMTDRMVEDAARRRELYDEQIAETQRSLDLELQLMEDGYANNVDAKRKEIEKLKKLRAEALKNEEEAIRKQRIAESIIQGVNLATSVTQILKEYTKIPLIGIGLAGAAIAALFTLFSSAKSRAAASTKLAEGGTGTETGMITGKSHAAGGEHFLSHVEVERGERWGVLNRKASDRFGRTFDYMVSSFNKGEMPQFSEPEYSNNVTVNNDGSNSRLDKVISEQRKLNKKFNADQIILSGQKKIIRNGNKLRIVG